MGTLWGSKKDGDDHEDRDEEQQQEEARAGSSHSQPTRRSEDASERSRLLPRHDQGTTYLSPDDPAVSLYAAIHV